MRVIFLFSILIGLLISCGPGARDPVKEQLSSEEQMLYEKYLIQGKEIYKTSCQNCHMGNGKGLKKLIPPLSNSDYLEKNQGSIPCLIKFGAKESMTVNGIVYEPVMPAHGSLSVLEIAEVMTYINNSWDNQFGFVKASQVEEYLAECD